MNKVGLVLEGGGSKGAFTVGVLDCFMDNKIKFPYVIGVSAGALNAINYVSEQKGRARATSVDMINQKDMISFMNVFSNHSIFDLELMFDKLPNEIIPFDYDKYFSSDTRCVITATNCNTGKPAYLEEREDPKRLMQLLQASAALPFLAPIVNIDAIPYLDGGVADPIPIREAITNGYKKNVVVLTKNAGYRKSKSTFEKNMAILFYNKYPNLVKAMVRRYKLYNKEMEYIEKLEKKGKILVIRPEEEFMVSRTEKDHEKLTQLCEHGYKMAEKMCEKIEEFMAND